MSEKLASALAGLTAAVATFLVAIGVLGGEDAAAGQALVLAVITFLSAIGIRSMRPKK